MKHEKLGLSFDEQADRLCQRGMAGARELLKSRLAAGHGREVVYNLRVKHCKYV